MTSQEIILEAKQLTNSRFILKRRVSEGAGTGIAIAVVPNNIWKA